MRRLLTALIQRPEVRYLIFGGLNTAFSYGLYTVALVALNAVGMPGDFAIATTFSWLVSNLTSFVLQRAFVFKGNGLPLREFLKFTSVTFGSFATNIALGWFAVAVLGLTEQWEKLLSQLVITLVLVIITYGLHRSFSFSKRRNDPHPEPLGMVAMEEGVDVGLRGHSEEDR